jgi:hypothetical protein
VLITIIFTFSRGSMVFASLITPVIPPCPVSWEYSLLAPVHTAHKKILERINFRANSVLKKEFTIIKSSII